LSQVLFEIIKKADCTYEDGIKALANTMLCIADGARYSDEGFKSFLEALMIAYREREVKGLENE
jgi:hypothetical protein